MERYSWYIPFEQFSKHPAFAAGCSCFWATTHQPMADGLQKIGTSGHWVIGGFRHSGFFTPGMGSSPSAALRAPAFGLQQKR